jgi:hypothetical protein
MAIHEVWKYQFPDDRLEYTHMIPYGAFPVHYALQNGVPTVWYEVNPANTKLPHTFKAIMTGEPFEIDEYTRDQRHVGSFMVDWLVVHIYDVTPFQAFNVKDFVFSIVDEVKGK